MANNFITEDKERAYQFGAFIVEHARWADINTKQALELNRHLAWFNSLPAKIDSNIFEITKVHTPAESQVADLKKGKGK